MTAVDLATGIYIQYKHTETREW